jgi:ribonuclease HI
MCPRAEGGRGSLFSLRGIQLGTYDWGLGVTMNNIAKAYALFEGLRMAKERKISQITVFGDSMLIVKAIITRK